MHIKIFCAVVSLLLLALISTSFLQPQGKKAAASAAPISTNSEGYSNEYDGYTKVTNADINSTDNHTGKAEVLANAFLTVLLISLFDNKAWISE